MGTYGHIVAISLMTRWFFCPSKQQILDRQLYFDHKEQDKVQNNVCPSSSALLAGRGGLRSTRCRVIGVHWVPARRGLLRRYFPNMISVIMVNINKCETYCGRRRRRKNKLLLLRRVVPLVGFLEGGGAAGASPYLIVPPPRGAATQPVCGPIRQLGAVGTPAQVSTSSCGRTGSTAWLFDCLKVLEHSASECNYSAAETPKCAIIKDWGTEHFRGINMDANKQLALLTVCHVFSRVPELKPSISSSKLSDFSL